MGLAVVKVGKAGGISTRSETPVGFGKARQRWWFSQPVQRAGAQITKANTDDGGGAVMNEAKE